MSKVDDILERFRKFGWCKCTEDPFHIGDLVLSGIIGNDYNYDDHCTPIDNDIGIISFERYCGNKWSVSFIEMKSSICLEEIKLIKELIEALEKGSIIVNSK